MKRIWFVLVLLPAAAFALDLDTARDLALANSRSLARYQLATENALWDEKIQGYAVLPSLSLGLSASANLWGEPGFPDSLGAGASFGVSQKVYDGGKQGLLNSINRIATEITRQEALGEYFAVLDAVDAAYYGVLEAEAALEAAISAREAAALALDMAEIRLESGMISYGDYLQALAEKESKETAWNQARRDLTVNKGKLKNLTALTEIPALEAADVAGQEGLIQKLAELSEAGTGALVGAFQEIAAIKNPDLAKAGLQNARAEQSVALSRRDYFPSLNAGISGGLNYSLQNGFEAPTGRISLSGTIPLDIWVTGANVAKKEIAREEAVLELQNAESSLNMTVETAVLDLVSLAFSARSSRRADEYAQRHYEQVLELYRLSQTSVAALSDAAALAESNRTQYIKARYGFLGGLSTLRSLGCFASDEELWALLSVQLAALR
jgi:outer membrane protein TolC